MSGKANLSIAGSIVYIGLSGAIEIDWTTEVAFRGGKGDCVIEYAPDAMAIGSGPEEKSLLLTAAEVSAVSLVICVVVETAGGEGVSTIVSRSDRETRS